MTYMSTRTESFRLLVIANPTAGWGRQHRIQAVLAALKLRGAAVTLRWTQRRGDAEAFAAAASRRDYDRVVVAGGDGTINEAINGLAIAADAPPLAVIPTGTANVLAAEIGLAARPVAIAAAIMDGAARRVHLGRIESKGAMRRFSMMAGVGFDAWVVARVDLRVKKLFGKGAYVAASLAQLWRGVDTYYDVKVDGVARRAASVIAANGHFYGGRFVIARAARLDDPALHVCLFNRAGRWNAVRYAIALMLGRLDKLPDIEILRAQRIEITGPVGEAAQVDGDLDGALPLVISVDEVSLSLAMPVTANSADAATSRAALV